ncbi:MAG: hypothetical protein IPL55_08065 [Saprospiraceae bacterium]|nr:hypothetical protein [Saprospiraceae bacterium]
MNKPKNQVGRPTYRLDLPGLLSIDGICDYRLVVFTRENIPGHETEQIRAG